MSDGNWICVNSRDVRESESCESNRVRLSYPVFFSCLSLGTWNPSGCTVVLLLIKRSMPIPCLQLQLFSRNISYQPENSCVSFRNMGAMARNSLSEHVKIKSRKKSISTYTILYIPNFIIYFFVVTISTQRCSKLIVSNKDSDN